MAWDRIVWIVSFRVGSHRVDCIIAWDCIVWDRILWIASCGLHRADCIAWITVGLYRADCLVKSHCEDCIVRSHRADCMH